MLFTNAKAGAAVLAILIESKRVLKLSYSNRDGFFSKTKTADANALLRLRVSVSKDRCVIKEFVRGLLGKEEQLVRVLNDFHASSVLLAERDSWRVASRLDFWAWETEFAVVFGVIGSCGGVVVVRLSAKIEGWRNE